MATKPKRELGETADAEAVEESRDKDKLAAAQQDADLSWLMSQMAGRRVAALILRWARVGSNRFNPNDRIEAFELGEQNIGHRLLAEIRRHSLDKVRLMEDEERRP